MTFKGNQMSLVIAQSHNFRTLIWQMDGHILTEYIIKYTKNWNKIHISQKATKLEELKIQCVHEKTAP